MIQINTVPIAWKGATVAQSTPALRLNDPAAMTGDAIFRSRPLRSYRRELVSTDASSSTVARSNFRIETYPGAASTVAAGTVTTGLAQTNTYVYPNNASELPGSTGAAGCSGVVPETGVTVCTATATNALARVRRIGNMKQAYSNSTAQYLRSRDKSYAQNTFGYVNRCTDTGGPCTVDDKTHGIRIELGDNDSTTRTVFGTRAAIGADSSSARTLALKYTNITCAAKSYLEPYGAATANELAYSSNTGAAYTEKTRTGFPVTTYPVFTPTGEQRVACQPPRG
jgi:hypothetical protein